MTVADFRNALKRARRSRTETLYATLVTPLHGVRNIRIRNVDGQVNGDHNDLWVESRSGNTMVARVNAKRPDEFVALIDSLA